MYGTPHYQALVCRFTELHPEVDDILFAHEMYRSRDEWRAAYREKIARVTVCYALTDLNGYIGAGQFAELASMYGSDHPLQKLVAVRPYLRSKHRDNVEFVTAGHFALFDGWDFYRCAMLVRRGGVKNTHQTKRHRYSQEKARASPSAKQSQVTPFT
jgi:hypothetical protein